MKLGIAGYGIVGKATHKGLLKNQSVIIHDLTLSTKLEDLSVCEYVFFCLPTNNDTDIQSLLEEIKLLKSYNPNSKIVIRSTLPVGTCSLLETVIQDNIYYVPEFLRERMWEEDCFNRPVIVGNNNKELPSWISEEESIICSLEEAEIIKMFSNNIASARIIIANHFYELSKAVGADYQSVLDAYLQVNHDQNYLEANENLRGFGGKCLPKDLNFLISTFDKLNLPQQFFTAVREDNSLWPTTVKTS
jgi:UDPglucose 6-dehydrogenase